MYKAGKSCEEIAKVLGGHAATVRRRLLDSGIPIRKPWESNALHYQTEIDLSGAIRLYVEGEGLVTLAKEYGIGPRRLRRALILAGVPVRSCSESLLYTYKRMTESQRAAIAAHANNAKRGKCASVEALERRADTCERTLQLASRADLMMYAWLSGRGLPVTPQKAVGIYNVDVAVHTPAIAVEVNGHWHHFRDNASTPEKRREYLFDRGWGVIDVYLTAAPNLSWKYLRPTCADKIIAILDGLGGNIPVAGKHWVIGGDGEPFTGSGSESDDRATVFGPISDSGVGRIDN
jgi:very-short-patch-repair endonuclease